MSVLPEGVVGGYPAGPAELSWPIGDWPRGEASVDLGALLERALDPDGPLATSYAVVIVEGGRIVAEVYNGALGSFVDEPRPVEASTPLLSWSMAKSMLSIVVGSLIAEGRLELDAPAAVPEWSAPDDPRGQITLRDLLEMRDGLDFVEEYSDEGVSDVIEMLFGSGTADMAHFAADRPLAAPPGSRFNYSSGTTNIISRLVGDLLGGEDAMRAALDERLFGPLAMTSARPSFDEAGTFIASSYVHATAQDFARFGLMLCRGGMAGATRIVPTTYIDYLRRPRSIDEDDGFFYSAQFWVQGDEQGSFSCHGYEGQRIIAVPPLDLVIVRLGQTSSDFSSQLRAWEDDLIAAFADAR